MTPTLTHVALHVRDLAACVAFYREFCGLACVHERDGGDGEDGGDGGGPQVVWLAEPGRAREFILVLLAGGPGRDQGEGDYSHFGFALDSRAAVDAIAEKAKAAGCLLWPPREEPYPVGYYCGLRDPDGNAVEFSYGQPLGPGAPPEVAAADPEP
jgi:catechol 2,3-dioxygenase-like lactoylglutathione lyase family enzyme